MTEYTVGSNVSLSLYVYEPFSFRWSYPGATSFVVTTSTFLAGSITKDASGVNFASSGYSLTSSFETLVIQAYDSGSNLLGVSSNTVTVGAGRFVDDVSASLSGRRFTFYRNEPIVSTVFSAAFPLSGAPLPAIGTPSLPAGLSFVSNAPSRYTLQGTPVLQTPSNTYSFIGCNTTTSQQASTTFNLAVAAERMVLDLSGNGLVSLMQVGTAISPQSLYAKCPPYPRQFPNLSNIQYTWTQLPLGLEFTDSTGVPRSSPFTPFDASATLILQGTPTLEGAKQFANLNISQATVGVTANRIGSTSVAASQAFIASFRETVLFDDFPTFKFYKDVALDPSVNFVRARTYFATTDVSITDITALSLPPGLSLTFASNEARAYLSGTPTAIGTASYTFRASNANGSNQDAPASLQVVADSVTITGPADVSYNFILSRPVSTAFAGYYPSPISWTATAASSQAVTFSAPALAGTGLSLSVSGNTATLSGIPDTATSLQNLRITATAGLTGATASRDVSFAVVPDIFTFASIPASNLSFIQNKAITPVQVTATTLSERSIVAYSSSNLPSGLALSTGGVLSGTPLVDVNGSFTVVASTGYASGSQVYSYAITPDVLLFQVDPLAYNYSPGAAVSIDLNGVAYSGTSVSNYTFSNFTPSYGLSIGSTTGIISGNLVDGLPPGLLFPVSCNFTVNATAGSLDASLSATMVTTNPVVHRNFLLVQLNALPGGSSGVMEGVYITDNDTLSNWTMAPTIDPGTYTDFRKKNATVDSNTYLLCAGINVLRSTDGISFSSNVLGTVGLSNSAYTAWNVSNSSNWLVAGTSYDLANSATRVFLWASADDGQTWTRNGLGGMRLAPRQSDSNANYYSFNGVAFASNSNVVLLGGGLSPAFMDSDTVLRSTDGGSTWSNVQKPLEVEVATFNTQASRWIMAGSSFYSLGNSPASNSFTVSATTLRYSDDQGDTWNDASGSTPDVGTFVVAYASNTWLAAGMKIYDVYNETTQLVCSSNGYVWSNVTLPETFTLFDTQRLPEVGPIWSDSSNWRVMVKMNNVGLSPPDYRCRIYSHSLTGDLTTGWTLDVSDATPFAQGTNYMSQFEENFVRTGTPTTVTFTFNATPAGGPVVTSPTSTSLLFYQYVRFTPIQITATGTGTIYYFADTAELPDGITFDPLTATLSGKSVVLGNKTFNVYAKDDIGVTKIVFQTTTVLPSVTRTQSNASAYTSYLRQYTVVNAARTSENNEVYPSETTTIGEFTRPYPPSETTATVDPKCYSTSNCP
jgi:hypothetical protein